jgi:hypothetical protein
MRATHLLAVVSQYAESTHWSSKEDVHAPPTGANATQAPLFESQ